MVIVPVNAHIHEAQDVAQKNRSDSTQTLKSRVVWHLHFENHDRDNDGQNAITECFESVFSHRFSSNVIVTCFRNEWLLPRMVLLVATHVSYGRAEYHLSYQLPWMFSLIPLLSQKPRRALIVIILFFYCVFAFFSFFFTFFLHFFVHFTTIVFFNFDFFVVFGKSPRKPNSSSK